MKNDKPFRVLALDGGGMRGLHTAVVLDTLAKRICDKQGKIDVGKGFDLIVGTSTGGILAAGLANGFSTSDIIFFYEEHGHAIFEIPAIILKKIKYPTTAAAEKRRKSLKVALERQFSEITIGQMWNNRKIAICIPAVNMATQEAWVFKTPHIEGKNRDNNYKLVDVCLATSAAPTYFPLAVIEDPDNKGSHQVFADGGLWANNPSLLGLIEALEITKSEQDIQIISVGTAAHSMGKVIRKKDANFPIFSCRGKNNWDWGRAIFETMLGSQASSTSFILKFIAPHFKSNIEYIRIGDSKPSPEQEKYIGLDKADEKAIIALKLLGKRAAEIDVLSSNPTLTESKVDILKEIFTGMPILDAN